MKVIFTIEGSQENHQTQKAGRGSKTKRNVMVMAESTPLEDIETKSKSSQCGYFKAKVLTNHKVDGVNETIQEYLDQKSIVFTDKSTSYVDISDFIELHITEKSSKETTKET